MEPIDDKSDLTLVILKNDRPHCKIHGAMNCNNVTEKHRWYRCFSAYTRTKDRACEAACMIRRS